MLYIFAAEVTNSGCAIDSDKNHIGMTSFPCKMCLRCKPSLLHSSVWLLIIAPFIWVATMGFKI